MIRSAAKNQAYVGVVVDPDDYPAVLAELRARGGLDDATRARLARKAFERTARYDTAIHALARASQRRGRRPAIRSRPTSSIELARAATLRYGENPHQRAALYGRFFDVAEPLHGKELSFNNIVDVQAALALIAEFAHADRTAVAILKHNTPCGVGLGATPRRGLPARVRDRSRVAVRRHHRGEPRRSISRSRAPSTRSSPRC